MDKSYEISAWIYDRIYQGEEEEVGSMDFTTIDDIKCELTKALDDYYSVTFNDDVYSEIVFGQYDTFLEIKTKVEDYLFENDLISKS